MTGRKVKNSWEFLGLEPVSLMIKKSRLRWFGNVERKDDNDWVKCCIKWEVRGIRQRGRPKKTGVDYVKNDMESLGLSEKDAQSRINGEEELRGQPRKSSSGKMAIKMECVCWVNVSVCGHCFDCWFGVIWPLLHQQSPKVLLWETWVPNLWVMSGKRSQLKILNQK